MWRTGRRTPAGERKREGTGDKHMTYPRHRQTVSRDTALEQSSIPTMIQYIDPRSTFASR